MDDTIAMRVTGVLFPTIVPAYRIAIAGTYRARIAEGDRAISRGVLAETANSPRPSKICLSFWGVVPIGAGTPGGISGAFHFAIEDKI